MKNLFFISKKNLNILIIAVLLSITVLFSSCIIITETPAQKNYDSQWTIVNDFDYTMEAEIEFVELEYDLVYNWYHGWHYEPNHYTVVYHTKRVTIYPGEKHTFNLNVYKYTDSRDNYYIQSRILVPYLDFDYVGFSYRPSEIYGRQFVSYEAYDMDACYTKKINLQ